MAGTKKIHGLVFEDHTPSKRQKKKKVKKRGAQKAKR